MQAVTCEPELATHTVEFWSPLAISVAGLPVCCVFAYDCIRRYARVMFPSNRSTTAQDHSNREENESEPPSSSSCDGNSNLRSIGSDVERSFPQSRATSLSPFANQAWVSFTTSLNRTINLLWPKSTNQLLITTSLLCWITMCIDQLFSIGQNYMVSVFCPQWACRNARPTDTPGCPAGTLILAVPGLNSLGLFFYAYGAIYRFVRVYSTMSPIRHLISRMCLAILVVLLVARLASLALLSHVRFFPMPNTLVASDDGVIAQMAAPVFTTVYSIFFSAILVIDVVCTGISVHFVLDCRARLRALVLESTKAATNARGSVAVPVIAGTATATATDVEHSLLVPLNPSGLPAAQDCRRYQSLRRASSTLHSPTHGPGSSSGNETPIAAPAAFQQRPSVASSKIPIITSPRSTGGSFSSGVITTVPSLKRAAKSEKKHMRMKAIVSRILLLTGVKLGIFGIFSLVRFTSLVEGKVSVRVVDALLQLTLKLVVAAATVGITFVTRLVALRNWE